MNVLENYLMEIQMNEDFQYLSEDIKSFVSKLKNINIKNITSSLQTSAKSKDLDKIKKTINSINVPTVPNNSIVNNMKKILPDFQKSYELSKKVVSNSVPEISDKLADSVSIAIAAKSTYKSNKPMDDTKDNLITTVQQLRKYIGNVTSIDTGAILGGVIVIIFAISGIVVIAAYGFASLMVLVIVGSLLMVLKNLLSD